MKAKFSWDTDETSVEDDVGSGAQLGRPSRRILWVVMLAALVLFLVIYWQVQRIRSREEVIRNDIRASYLVWYRAVQSEDLELFLNQLSPQDSAWRAEQEQLFKQGQLLSWSMLGLEQANPQRDPPQIESIELAPDWQTAEVTVRYAYRNRHGPDQSPRYFLHRHSFSYHTADGRWLLAPPAPDFWGAQTDRNSTLFALTYPARDGQLITRLAQDWQQQVDQLCNEAKKTEGACPAATNIALTFTTDVEELTASRLTFSPLFEQSEYILPAPSLVGIPADDAAYLALSQAYSGDLIAAVREDISPPLPLPKEEVQILCFPEGESTIQLFRYTPQTESWQHELPGRAFRFLMPFPEGDGVLLQPLLSDNDPGRLRLLHWQDGNETLLYDGQMRDHISRPAGWGLSRQPRLLLQSISGMQQNAKYWLELDRCSGSGCRLTELPGFTTWSPDGNHTLIVRGSELLRGNGIGRPLQMLGTGLGPFWIDNEQYGFVRYDGDEGPPSMDVVVARVGIDEPQVILAVQSLSTVVDADESSLLFVNYIVANPSDPDLLLLSVTTVGSSAAKYHILSHRISTGDAHLLLQLEQQPTGYPVQLTPAGYAPFRLSPDGRWLLVTYLANRTPTEWAFELFDLQQETDQELTVTYPRYPARFPFYDWTPDGRWLAIVEDGYLRLVALGSGYERVTPFKFDACYYPAWVN